MGRKRVDKPDPEKAKSALNVKIQGDILLSLERYIAENPGENYATFVRVATRDRLKDKGYFPIPK
jgi:hypothetical protein